MNLTDFCVLKEKEYALLQVPKLHVVLQLPFCATIVDYLFEKAFSGMTQVKTKHTQRVCLSTTILARLVTISHSSKIKWHIGHGFAFWFIINLFHSSVVKAADNYSNIGIAL